MTQFCVMTKSENVREQALIGTIHAEFVAWYAQMTPCPLRWKVWSSLACDEIESNLHRWLAIHDSGDTFVSVRVHDKDWITVARTKVDSNTVPTVCHKTVMYCCD
jgi:hypothetical protein